jgi:uncharacterized protein with HEPN domain
MALLHRRHVRHTSGLDQPAFVANLLVCDATPRNLELGEAASHVPEEVRLANSRVPGRRIVATRDRLIHGCVGIDKDTLCSFVMTDVPALLSELQNLRRVAC